jgi:hypothetical protein
MLKITEAFASLERIDGKLLQGLLWERKPHDDRIQLFVLSREYENPDSTSGSSMTRFVKIIALTAGLALAGVAGAQAPPPIRIRGDIVSLNGDTLTVDRRSGDTVTIALKSDVPISAVRNLAMADIKPGSFIGITAKVDKKGNLTAQEVHVIPESGRGTGEGHYAWDLSPHSTMTNANVDAVVQNTMAAICTCRIREGTTRSPFRRMSRS